MDPITLQLLLLLAFGLLQLFFGYPLFRVLVVVSGAALGFAYAPALLSDLTGTAPDPWLVLALAVAAAVILGLLAWFAFRLLVFLWGFSFGYGVMVAAGAGLLPALLAGVLIGGLAALFQKALIVALTAIGGAGLVVYVVLAFIGAAPPAGFDPVATPPWLGLVILGLAAVGGVVQFRRATPPFRF